MTSLENKLVNLIVIVVLSGLAHLGCTQNSVEKPTKKAKLEFDVTTKDTPISEESLLNAKFLSGRSAGEIIAQDTVDVFLLSENLMKLAELEKRGEQTYLPYFGHVVAQTFYTDPANYTAYRADEAPYVEVAIAVKEKSPPGERLTDLVRSNYMDASVCIRERILDIETRDFPEYQTRKSAFWDNSIYSEYDVSPYFAAIKEFLERVQFHITADSGVTREDPCVPMALAQALRDTIDQEFMPQIDQLNAQFAGVSDEMEPEEILDRIEDAYLSVELFEGTSVIEEIQAIVEQGRRDVRSRWNRTADRIWLTNLKHEVLKRHANALIEYVNDLGPLIADSVESALHQRVSSENILGELLLIGEGEVQRIFFGNLDYRPAVERADAALVLGENKLEIQVDPADTSDERQSTLPSVVTGGETLGVSINLLAQRIKTMEALEGPKPQTREFQYQLFSHFNKMVKAVGHYDVNGKSEGAFYRPMKSAPDSPQFDVYHYHEDSVESTYYGIPDSFRVDAPFRLVEGSIKENSRVTVASISEWIRGASQMMDFVDPSTGGLFDQSLALHVYADEFQVFPRESLFDLHLAIAATHLLNLMRDGISIINRQGEAVRIQEIDDLSTYPGLMAAPHDVVLDGRTDAVISKDVGKLMRAISEFLEVTAGLPDGVTGSFRSKWSERFQELLNRDLGDLGRNLGLQYSCGNPQKRNKIENLYASLGKGISSEATEFLECRNRKEVSENYELLQDAKDKLKILLFGLGFYLASEFQYENGGFYTKGELGVEGSQDGYDLESQVHVMRGLVAAYRQGWQSRLFQFLVADAYHKMNAELYNEALGFYQVSKENKKMPSLRLVAETLAVLHEIEEFIPESSREQLRRNRRVWSQKLSREFQTLYSMEE